MELWGDWVPQMLDLMTRLPVSLHDNTYDDFYYLQSLAPCAPFKVSTDMTIFNFPMVTLGCSPGFRQTVSHKLQTKCQATQALLHVISLVDWPKHVKSRSGGCLDQSGDRILLFAISNSTH